jgi:hypothetical protein
MPYLYTWQRVMAKERGELEAAMLASRVQSRYEELYVQRPRFSHRALRLHLERIILPGLALYQVLGEESGGREAALAEVETLFQAVFGRFRRLMPPLALFPNPFAVFRRAVWWVMQVGFPPQGWEVDWVEDSDQCLAYDVRRCFYLDILTSYGTPELTALYCNADDLAFDALPSSITWERTKTLGRGDAVCDFRWCHASRK